MVSSQTLRLSWYCTGWAERPVPASNGIMQKAEARIIKTEYNNPLGRSVLFRASDVEFGTKAAPTGGHETELPHLGTIKGVL